MWKIFGHGYAYITVITANIAAVISGFSMAWSSPMIAKLNKLDDNPLGRRASTSEQSILASVHALGCFLGIIASGYIARVYGRKTAIIVNILPSALAYSLMAYSTDVWELVLLRMMTGMTIGGVNIVNNMYSAECANKSSRGLLGTILMIFTNIGIISILILSSMMSYFWLHAILAMFSVSFFSCAALVVVESPVFLLQKNEDEAEKILKKLRGRSNIVEELDDLKQSSNDFSQQANILKTLHNRGFCRAFLMASFLIIFQHVVGIIVANSFAQFIFKEAGNFVPEELGPIIVASVALLASILTPLVIRRSGRKSMLVFSHIAIFFAEVPLGVFFILKEIQYEISYFEWIPLTFLILLNIAYSFGLSSIPFIFISEVFPTEMKEIGMSLCLCFSTLCTFIMLYVFVPLQNLIGTGPVFLIFSLCSLIGALYSKFVLIETEGKSLSDIQKIFHEH